MVVIGKIEGGKGQLKRLRGQNGKGENIPCRELVTRILGGVSGLDCFSYVGSPSHSIVNEGNN